MGKEKPKFNLKSIAGEFRDHWNIPADGKHVPYKEYISVFFAVGGDYALTRVLNYLGFGIGCYLIAYYYEIPILTFSVINAFFMIQGYFWSILSMMVNDNLGILPPKTEKIFNAIYIAFTLLGIVFLIVDFSEIIPFSNSVENYLNSLPGLDIKSIFKIFAAHWLVTGYGGLRNIFYRKRLLKKFGRYKLFAYPNVIPCLISVLLICWLPLYEKPLTERVWQLFLLFQIYGMFTYKDSAMRVFHKE